MPDSPSKAIIRQMGLARCVFALGYLWLLALDDGRVLANVPLRDTQSSVTLLQYLPSSPSEAWFQLLDAALVLALLLLAMGSRVWLATTLVLVLGVLREAYGTLPDVESGNVVHAVFIPLFALATGAWGAGFSVDRATTVARAASTDTHEMVGDRLLLMRRCLLILVSALFFLSALWKVTGGGMWLTNDGLLRALMIDRSALSAATGGWANPLVPWLVSYPWIGSFLQYGALLFEATFWLALLGGLRQRFYLALALVFHGVNALWLMIGFTPILLLYALFVDWESLRQVGNAWWRNRRRSPSRAPLPEAALSSVAQGIAAHSQRRRMAPVVAWTIAICIAATWHAGARAIFTLGGVLTAQRMWMCVTALAVCMLLHTIWRGLARWFTAAAHRAPVTAVS